MGPVVRYLLTVGLLGVIALVVARRRRQAGADGGAPLIPTASWPPVPRAPARNGGEARAAPGPVTASSSAPAGARRWVDPEDRGCPASHPIKAKLGSGIYHRPRMAAYNRTIPDRCYASVEDAEADGFRPARR